MKWKTKKTTRVFLYINYSKFWSVLLEHFVERKPLIYEECVCLLLKNTVHCCCVPTQHAFGSLWPRWRIVVPWWPTWHTFGLGQSPMSSEIVWQSVKTHSRQRLPNWLHKSRCIKAPTSVVKVSEFKSLTRLQDFLKKSHEIFKTFETSKTWKFQCKCEVNIV